ncbi:hypothetical protein PSOS111911_07150 [Pseudoalteromonas ostreae]
MQEYKVSHKQGSSKKHIEFFHRQSLLIVELHVNLLFLSIASLSNLMEIIYV